MATSVPDGLVQVILSFIALLQGTQLSEADSGRKRENQVMGHLVFKEQACLPHPQPHREDVYLPAEQPSQSPEIRDQRRLSQGTTVASNRALLSPSLRIACLPNCSEKEYAVLGHLPENRKLECKPTQTVSGRGL